MFYIKTIIISLCISYVDCQASSSTSKSKHCKKQRIIYSKEQIALAHELLVEYDNSSVEYAQDLKNDHDYENIEQDFIDSIVNKDNNLLKRIEKRFKAYNYQDVQGHNVTLKNICNKQYKFPGEDKPMTSLEYGVYKYWYNNDEINMSLRKFGARLPLTLQPI